MYLACPTKPLKGPELSTLNFGRTLVFEASRQGMAQFILNILISCMYRTTVRTGCIFVISRFRTTFSYEMTVVSEIHCQNLKDKTSILSLGQIIKMRYCRIHVHVHA